MIPHIFDHFCFALSDEAKRSSNVIVRQPKSRTPSTEKQTTIVPFFWCNFNFAEISKTLKEESIKQNVYERDYMNTWCHRDESTAFIKKEDMESDYLQTSSELTGVPSHALCGLTFETAAIFTEAQTDLVCSFFQWHKDHFGSKFDPIILDKGVVAKLKKWQATNQNYTYDTIFYVAKFIDEFRRFSNSQYPVPRKHGFAHQGQFKRWFSKRHGRPFSIISDYGNIPELTKQWTSDFNPEYRDTMAEIAHDLGTYYITKYARGLIVTAMLGDEIVGESNTIANKPKPFGYTTSPKDEHARKMRKHFDDWHFLSFGHALSVAESSAASVETRTQIWKDLDSEISDEDVVAVRRSIAGECEAIVAGEALERSSRLSEEYGLNIDQPKSWLNYLLSRDGYFVNIGDGKHFISQIDIGPEGKNIPYLLREPLLVSAFQKVYNLESIDFPRFPKEETEEYVTRVTLFLRELLICEKEGIKVEARKTSGLRCRDEDSTVFLTRSGFFDVGSLPEEQEVVSPPAFAMLGLSNKTKTAQPVSTPTTHEIDESQFSRLIGFIPK